MDSEEKILNIKELEIDYYSNPEEIKYFPKEIFKLASLESFCIRNCDNIKRSFKKNIKNIGKLINLKKLEISSWNMKTLPKEIFNLSNLESLDINCCSLKKLPTGISALAKLKTLKFTYCQDLINVEKVYKDIFNLENLENIRLIYFNRFEGLYKKLNDLDNIKNIELEFDFDEFEFPKEILELSKLKTLDISSKKIEKKNCLRK